MSKSVVPKALIFSTLTTTLTILIGIALSSTTVRALDSGEALRLNVLSTCTLSATGTETHNASTGGSVYIPDIGTSTIGAFCNDTAGFAIYAVGFTDDEEGKNVLTDASLGANYDIVTGTATGGSTSNWAMKLNILQDSGDISDANAFTLDNDFGSYHTVPSTPTKVAHKNVSTDMTSATGGVKFTSTYAIFASPTQPAGSYHGRVKYTLIHPATEVSPQPQPSSPGTITYYANADKAIGTMGSQSAVDNMSVTLLASNFSREGYGFAGWSDAYDYATNRNAKFYGPQETIAAPVGTTANGLSLYAVWIESHGSLQDRNQVTSICNNLKMPSADGTANLSSVSALTDHRDNNVYAIAKLADGRCWMIENLRLESTAAHNSDGALAQGYGTSDTYGNFGGLANAESSNFHETNTPNSLYYIGTQEGTASINIGTSGAATSRMPRYNNWNNQPLSLNRPYNPNSNYAFNVDTQARLYSYGNYYTWHAAIADLTYHSSNNVSVTSTSLCPNGWHLPSGGNSYHEAKNDFWTLIVNGIHGGLYPTNYSSTYRPYYDNGEEGAEASNKVRAFPNNFHLFGNLLSTQGGENIVMGGGLYWTSTSGSYSVSYILDVHDGYIWPGTALVGKSIGGYIRCIAD